MTRAALTRLDVFTVPTTAVPRAVARMATDRRRLARSGTGFWKLLGTGDGRTFDARDADLRRWAVLTTWPTPDAADAFGAASDVVSGWGRIADEHWWIALRAIRVAGRWSGQQPFGEHGVQSAPGADGVEGRDGGGAEPVAVVTRARLRWSRAPRFWRSVAPVNRDLDRADGLRVRLGIGEAPVGLQGTFSVWDSLGAMRAFAHRGAPHRDVMRRSTAERWYVEELFARFAVVAHGGTVFGADPLGG